MDNPIVNQESEVCTNRKHEKSKRKRLSQKYRLNSPDGMGYCSDCQQYKSKSDFSRESRSPCGLKTLCKECYKSRKYPQGKVTPESERKRQLKYKYSIDQSAYQAILDKQGGVCAICKGPPVKNKNSKISFHIDHDHETGKIRGLLCRRCNIGLGQFRDNQLFLRAAIEYLDNSGT